ncbi:Importin subunit alpha-1b, partial [Geodia barretti]
MVVESGVIPVLVPILTHPDNKVLLPVLRTLGNITTGSTEETQAVLDGGILPYLPNLATDTTPDISAVGHAISRVLLRACKRSSAH